MRDQFIFVFYYKVVRVDLDNCADGTKFLWLELIVNKLLDVTNLWDTWQIVDKSRKHFGAFIINRD